MKKFYISLLFLFAGLFGFGQSAEVGVTEGELSVSLTGAANYKIPIAVPAGINGVVPQISLAYNSQGGLGLAGFGWNIMGISAITRVPSTMYHDGIIDPVDFNALDRFALDDKRLILKSSEKFDIGATKRVYETEMFSNLKISYYNGQIQDNRYQDIVLMPIDYFIVEYPDGSSAKYENHGSATDWTISYWENPQGAYISYEYNTEYSGAYSPTSNASIEKIRYGSLKSSSNQINEVQFVYKSRNRVEQAYIGGKSFIRNKILSAINIKTNSQGFRSYSLAHDTSSLGYERLTSITEKSGDGLKSYNPTVFDYGENIVKTGTTSLPALYTLDGFNYGDESTPSTIVGDFDGDGDLDFMNDKVLFTKFYDDGSEPIKLDVSIPFSQSMNRTDIKATVTVKSLEEIGGKFKLMNRDSWCRQYSMYEGGRKSKIIFDIHSMDLKNKTAKLDYSKQFEIPSTGTNEFNAVVGDFNGDGLTDKIIFRNNTSNAYTTGEYFGDVELFFVNLDRRVSSDYVKNLGTISKIHYYNGIQTADVNGDGKTDLILFRAGSVNSIAVYSFDENNDLVKLWETPYNFVPKSYYYAGKPMVGTYVPGYDYPILSGDYNGDGKTDFILLGEEKKLILSTGKSFVVESLPVSFADNFKLGTLLSADFNNDGKTDVLNLTSNQTRNLQPISEVSLTIDCLTRSSAGVWSSSKDSFSNLNAKFYGALNPIMVKPSKLFNGKPELLLYEMETVLGYKTPEDLKNNNPSQSYPKAIKVGFFVKNDALTSAVKNIKSITNGNGIKENITYSPLINGNEIYTASSYLENFPNVDIESFPGFQVVSKIEKQSKDVYKKRLFSYYGAVTNVDGLGLLGFRSTVQTNWHNDSSPIISYITKNDMSLRGANIENYAVLGLHEPLFESSNQIESSIVKENNYTVTGSENLVATQSIKLKPQTKILSGSKFSAKINKEATSKSINEPSTFITKSVLAYESDLLPNKIFKIKNISNKQFNGLEGTSIETKTDYNDYNNPLKTTTTVKEGGAIAQTSIVDIEYENSAQPVYVIGRPIKKIQNVTLGSDKMTTEELYKYNSNQLLSEIKKKGDATTDYISEERLYDGFGNVAKRTLKAGQDSRELNYEYDTSGRFLFKSIDAEKLVTTYLYNPNGTLKSQTNPLGQTTTYEYDSWFKKVKETDYLSNTTNYSYTNGSGYVDITKTLADGSVFNERFDDLGRKIRSGSKNIMGTFSYVSYLYNIQDQNSRVSEPYIGSSPQWNEILYDDYGRIKTQNAYTGKTTEITYTGLTTEVNDGIITKTYKKDAVGNVVSMFDLPSNEIKYTYFANGNLKESNYDGIKVKMTQDGWGRKIQLDDPSAGIIKYQYNGFGELVTQENKNGITNYTLSPAGRLERKTISGLYTSSKTTYVYNTNKLLLKTEFEDGANGKIITDYTYDEHKRVNNKTEKTPYALFAKDFKYDSFGRVNTENVSAQVLESGKSSAKTLKYNYKNGSLYQITDDMSAVLWQTNTVNAREQLLSAQNGPITMTNVYNNNGFDIQFKFDKTTPSSNIFSLNAVFDVKTGNLDKRSNSLFGWNESFKHDNLDRLTEYVNVQGNKENQAYDNKGRITQNNLGTYNYSKENPYQNASITVSPEALPYYTAKPSQLINYNVFKSPVLIDEKDADKISFDYNDNNSRAAMFYGDLNDEKLKRPFRKYYAADGSVEIKENKQTGVTDFVTYIGGDGYTAPVVFKSDGIANKKYLYLQRDYQGSIVAITDQAGAVVEKRMFDAWGDITKVQDGAGNTLAGLTILDRGYTGHEHLQSVGLINMNARLYDPKLHRFLQPDNNIQDPFNTQNYNRYGYVMNNPLKYTDPSGEIWELVFGFFFSTYVHGGAASGGQANPFKWDANAWTSAFAGAASSAGSSLASSYATGMTNNYLDNYNNKPALGASAIGPGYDLSGHTSVDMAGFTGVPVTTSGLNSVDWYGPGGQVNWAFGLASALGVAKGTLNSERMYAEGIRRGLSGNYPLTGRNLSLFRDAPMTKTTVPISKVGQWGGILGHASFGVGVAMDVVGIWNYSLDSNSQNSVHPVKAGLNTIMGIMGNWGGTVGAIPSILYFGIDGFYPGSWTGLGIDQERLYRENKSINPNYQAFPGAMKM